MEARIKAKEAKLNKGANERNDRKRKQELAAKAEEDAILAEQMEAE